MRHQDLFKYLMLVVLVVVGVRFASGVSSGVA